MNEMKSASLNLRGDFVIMYPQNITTQGAGVSGEPVLVVNKNDLKGVGEGIIATLNASGNIIFHPEKWEAGRFNYVLKAAKVKSLREFMKGTKYLSVAIKDNNYVFWPTKNGGTIGPNKGFKFLPERETAVAIEASLDELNAAILKAFSLCE